MSFLKKFSQKKEDLQSKINQTCQDSWQSDFDNFENSKYKKQRSVSIVQKAIFENFSANEYYYWWRRVSLSYDNETNAVLLICENDFVRYYIKNYFFNRLIAAVSNQGIFLDLVEVLPKNNNPVGVLLEN